MNLYHSEESTLERVANIIGLEIVDAEVDGVDCYAFATVQDPEYIVFGPVIDGEPLLKEGVADHLLDILNEMDSDELNIRQIYKTLEKDEYGDWAYIYAMAEIFTICDDFSDDFCEETKATAAQNIIDTMIEIVETVLK